MHSNDFLSFMRAVHVFKSRAPRLFRFKRVHVQCKNPASPPILPINLEGPQIIFPVGGEEKRLAAARGVAAPAAELLVVLARAAPAA